MSNDIRIRFRAGLLIAVIIVGLFLAERKVVQNEVQQRIRTTVQSSPDRVEARLGHPLREHVKALAADLAEQGMAPERAKKLAPYIVSLAAHFELSPALIFGVMLTENRSFVSTATSSVGAKGLMQLMPETHAGLARICGPDRTNDVSNICAGIHVLAENLRRTSGDLDKALLRYNGCIRGTNTPNCFTYPNVVMKNAASGRWLCPEGDAAVCIARRVSWRDVPHD